MQLRNWLAAFVLAMTAANASAGIDTAPRMTQEPHRDFPRPMPPGVVMPAEVNDFLETIRDWFRPKLGRVMASEIL